MIRTIFVVLLIVSFHTLAIAKSDQRKSTTQCGDAAVEIIGLPYPDYQIGNALEKVTLRARTANRHIEKVFEGKTSRGEYFHAACVKGANKKYYIVFQNYCGGSACRDLDNYGIIDASSLEVLLMPSDTNRRKARKILGFDPPLILDDKGRFF